MPLLSRSEYNKRPAERPRLAVLGCQPSVETALQPAGSCRVPRIPAVQRRLPPPWMQRAAPYPFHRGDVQHPASPAVARPSCQTLGLARRTRVPACFCSHPSPARRPPVNLGRRTIAALQAVSSRTLRPAARLRGQRTIGSTHTRHFGVLHAVVALSSAHDRTLFSGRLALPSRFGTHRLGFRGCSSLAAVHARMIEIPFQSASALEAPPRVNVWSVRGRRCGSVGGVGAL